MRIAALTYTFSTPKIEAGVHHLVASGFKPDVILAAPPVHLDFYRSKVRIAPQAIPTMSPSDLALGHGIPFHTAPHDSIRAVEIFREYEIDVAVILGARILKRPLIEAATIGILNAHPGKLPENRGLDNMKWATLLGLPQFVTGHLIDHRIDRGREVYAEECLVVKGDTLMDVHLRLQALERKVMVNCLKILKRGDRRFPEIGAGVYRQAVPPEQEAGLMEAFEKYTEVRGV